MKNTKVFQGPAVCVSKVNGEKVKKCDFFSISVGSWGQGSVARSAIPEIFIAGASLYETEAIPLFFSRIAGLANVLWSKRRPPRGQNHDFS